MLYPALDHWPFLVPSEIFYPNILHMLYPTPDRWPFAGPSEMFYPNN